MSFSTGQFALVSMSLGITILGSNNAWAQDKIPASAVLERFETNGKVVYKTDELILESKDRLVVEEPAQVYIKKLTMQKDSVIDSLGNDLELRVEDDFSSDHSFIDVSPELSQNVSGSDGDNGVSGAKALDALKGVSGANGVDATNGTDGVDGADVVLWVPRITGDVALITRGGRGGNGGTGGAGGRGGDGLSGMDARVLFRFRFLDNLSLDTITGIGSLIGVPAVGQVLAILSFFNGLKIGDGFDGFDGGKGGNGGRGGNGGNGGRGGNIELMFASKTDSAKILVDTRGGRGGAAGVGGLSGLGGAGGAGGEAGDIWARDGKPGNPGATGLAGVSGISGKTGETGRVRVVQAPSEKWLECYITYRELIDLGEDRDFARQLLRECLN